MLICTKPTLLMKTQCWLPFIRLVMKYQYQLPSYSASVNRDSNKCVSLQTHLDPVTYINLEIAPDGCRKLISSSLDVRLFLGSGEGNWLKLSQQVGLSHSRRFGWCILSWRLYHSSEGSCEFMALVVNTYIRLCFSEREQVGHSDSYTGDLCVHSHQTRAHTRTHTHWARHTLLSKTGCLYKPLISKCWIEKLSNSPKFNINHEPPLICGI